MSHSRVRLIGRLLTSYATSYRKQPTAVYVLCETPHRCVRLKRRRIRWYHKLLVVSRLQQQEAACPTPFCCSDVVPVFLVLGPVRQGGPHRSVASLTQPHVTETIFVVPFHSLLKSPVPYHLRTQQRQLRRATTGTDWRSHDKKNPRQALSQLVKIQIRVFFVKVCYGKLLSLDS